MIRFYLLAIVLTAAVTTTSFIVTNNASGPPPEVEPIIPEQSTESGHIYAAGIVEGVTPEVEIRSEKPGRVVEIAVAEGDFVRQGDVLFRLDFREEAANLAAAHAALELAKGERQEAIRLWEAKIAELKGAEQDLERTARLLKTKAASAREADNQATRVDSLKAEVAAAAARVSPHSDGKSLTEARIDAERANVQLAEVLFDERVIRAPKDGQVLAINLELGELAGSETQEPSVVMADSSRLHVRAFVEELDATAVRIGDEARINGDGLRRRNIRGEVVFVSPRMAPKKLFRGKSEELYDVKTREVLIKILEDVELVIGLDVDVTIGTTDEHG